jgi:hypothetical protein
MRRRGDQWSISGGEGVYSDCFAKSFAPTM